MNLVAWLLGIWPIDPLPRSPRWVWVIVAAVVIPWGWRLWRDTK